MAQLGILPGHMVVDDLPGHRVARTFGQVLTTGRAAPLPVGEDESMHRAFLQFRATGATGTVPNHGSRFSASVHPRVEDPFVELRVGPGSGNDLSRYAQEDHRSPKRRPSRGDR